MLTRSLPQGKQYAKDRIRFFTLILLTRYKRPDQRIRSLRIQTQRVSQRLQLRTLLQERFLETVPASVEVQLDSVESRV